MIRKLWEKVRLELGKEPIVAGNVGGANPMFVERYVFQTIESAVSGYDATVLLTQFSASSVREGERDRVRGRSQASQSLLIPPNTPTRWVFSGMVDFVAFYLLPGGGHLTQSLVTLARSLTAPLRFSDPLAAAAALELVSEVQCGPVANLVYAESLASVLLERTVRILTALGNAEVDPSHMHYARVQAVIGHIRHHLTEDLSTPALAQRAGLSPTHFRRIFLDVVGMPLHTFILTARLDQARTFLSITTMSLSRIAQECGFSSQSHLAACFGKVYGCSPAQFRKQSSTPPQQRAALRACNR